MMIFLNDDYVSNANIVDDVGMANPFNALILMI